MNVAMADGMHSMEDLKAPPRRNAAGGRRATGDTSSPASPVPGAGRMGSRSDSLPTLPKDVERTTLGDATRFPRGFEHAEWGNTAASKKGHAAAGGPRRNKGMATTHMGISQP